MKKILVFALVFLLFVELVKAEEIGYSNKIEEAVENCVNCNVCPDGKVLESGKVCLYLFWGQGCPHCAEEKPFLEELKGKYPKLEVYEFEVYYNQENVKLWEEVCRKYGLQPIGVPMTFIGKKAFVGFSREKSGNSTPYSSNPSQSSPNWFLIPIILIPSIVALLLLKRKIKIKVKI
jgi:thiol-disulfide isomerase/thioredoxin